MAHDGNEATLGGLLASDKIVVSGVEAYDRLEIVGGNSTFNAKDVSVGRIATGDAIDLQYDVGLTDVDGDKSTGQIDMNLQPHNATGDNTFVGGSGNDILFGRAGNDTLAGAAGNDILSGDFDNDTLIGGAGNDVLSGGQGNDTIDVSEGSDRVRYLNPLDGNDVITGFNQGGQDNIDLDPLFDVTGVAEGERAALVRVQVVGPDTVITIDGDQNGFDVGSDVRTTLKDFTGPLTVGASEAEHITLGGL